MVLAIVDTMDMVLVMATMESVRLSQRLMLMLTCMVDTMVMVLDIADTMVMVLVLDTDIMESVKLSPRLMLMLICMEDTMDMVLDTGTMESVKLSQRLMLMHTCTVDTMDMVLDMPDTMDIPMVDIPTLDKLFPLISKWTANHPCFLYQCPHFQCLTSFLVTDSRKYGE